LINNGVYDFQFNNGGKNGEAIYVGTSSKQWDDGKNPTADPDESNNNWIHHNNINTLGNECVDIKEGATANIVEYNNCFGQKDSKSGGLDVRGDGNTLRYNQVHGNIGAGVRLGGHLVNGRQYGRNNHVYGNQIYDNLGGGIKFQEAPQGDICGNDAYNNAQGNETGTYRDSFNITAPCSPNPTETPTPSTPTATPEPPSGNTVHQFHEGNNWLEAEAFTNNNVGQWVVHSDDNQASAHRYMLLDTDDNQQEDDVMAYAFKIDYTGEIYVWYRGIRRAGSDRGIFLQLDDGPLVKATVDHETWGWHLDSDTDEWSIEPGEHVLRIYNRRKQVKIDALLITTDPDMDPANFEPYTSFMPVINN
ncbi:MAG: hypothetical protein KAG66_09465, partial [Methylococcales bacterium]|nr:hypothetical protein [Methylococcales bacterium]